MAELPARPLVVMPFLHSFEPGGVERVALRLCTAWTADPGLDIRLVMGRETGPLIAEAPPGLPRHVVGSGGVSTARWETLWLIFVLWRQVRAQRPDVLFAAGNTYAIVAVAMKLLLGRRCPPVVLKVSNDLARRDLPPPIRSVYALWLRIQGYHIDRFVGLAGPMQAEVAAAMQVPLARVAIIADPALDAATLIRLQAIAAERYRSPGCHYVAVGRLVAQKNFAMLIEAFVLAARPRDRLTIVGEGPERGKLERQRDRAEIADRIALPGHGDAEAAMAAGDVFVLTSDYEGVPAVVIEALASGMPVVATDCSVSMRSLIEGFGIVSPVGDARLFAKAMRRVLPPDRTRRQRAAEAVREFTVEVAAGRYAALLAETARRDRRSDAL